MCCIIIGASIVGVGVAAAVVTDGVLRATTQSGLISTVGSVLAKGASSLGETISGLGASNNSSILTGLGGLLSSASNVLTSIVSRVDAGQGSGFFSDIASLIFGGFSSVTSVVSGIGASTADWVATNSSSNLVSGAASAVSNVLNVVQTKTAETGLFPVDLGDSGSSSKNNSQAGAFSNDAVSPRGQGSNIDAVNVLVQAMANPSIASTNEFNNLSADLAYSPNLVVMNQTRGFAFN